MGKRLIVFAAKRRLRYTTADAGEYARWTQDDSQRSTQSGLDRVTQAG